MKLLSFTFLLIIQINCFAQSLKIKKPKGAYWGKHKKEYAHFELRNDSMMLNYSYCCSRFKMNKRNGYEYIKELNICMSMNSVRINVSHPIPDSTITIIGTYYISGNWYDGNIKYDSYEGQLTFIQMKKKRVKMNIYLTGNALNYTTILIDNRCLLFRKEK
ncbi:hypothetical protein [Cytophaga aurantiaca]|uniref:hypothetical protein n=1 Tax=Cytophaga aurantiaca TaxID=29530 RepID=UPI00037394AB|nr:hypothetical protein [Cytophaga aurantiaca]